MSSAHTPNEKTEFFEAVRKRFERLKKEKKTASRLVVEAMKSLAGPFGAPIAFIQAYYDVKREKDLVKDIRLSREEIEKVAKETKISTAWLRELQGMIPEITCRLEELEARISEVEEGQERQAVMTESLSMRVVALEAAPFIISGGVESEPPVIEHDLVKARELRYATMVADLVSDSSRALVEGDFELVKEIVERVG